jgi:hypothetical protein
MKWALPRGIGVIVLIVSVLAIAVAVFIAMSLYTGRGGVEPQDITAPIDRARDIGCASQIRKIEMQIQIYRVENDQYPQRLEMLEGLSDLDFCCPVTNNRYYYDASSGQVSCPDHIR